MSIWSSIGGWIISNAPTFFANFVKFSQGMKTIAESVNTSMDTAKKLAPDKLETKPIAQITEAVTVLNDQTRSVEEKQWDVQIRANLAETLVKTQVVESAYYLLRYAIFSAFTAVMFHFFVEIVKNLKKIKD